MFYRIKNKMQYYNSNIIILPLNLTSAKSLFLVTRHMHTMNNVH